MNKTAVILGLGTALILGTAAIVVLGSNSDLKETNTHESGTVATAQGTTTEGTVTQTMATSGIRNVMYYSDWSIWGGQGNFYPQDLPTHLYTHLNYAFLDFDSAGNLMFTDADAAVGANLNQEGVTWGDVNAGILPVLRAERVANPNMKLGISVGGWSKSGDFPTMASNASTRATFVSQIMKFLEYTGFDFVDLDWEYPGIVRQPDYTDNQNDEGNPAASAADKENYIKLLTELRVALDEQGSRLGKTYELSVALPMDAEKLEAGVDIPAMFAVIDFANIMTYDGRGAYDDVSGHHSPLYGNPADPMYEKGFSVDQSVSYLLEQGAPSEKIVIGAAFYSRGWGNIENTEVVSGLPGLFASASVSGNNADQSDSFGATNDLPMAVGDGGIAGGVWAFRNFDTLHSTYSGLVEYWDDVAKAPYLYNGSAFFTYDNAQSIAEKANYVLEHNLGGMISWQASNDAVTSTEGQRDQLTQAIYDGLFKGESLKTHEITSTPLDLTLTIKEYTENGKSGIEVTLVNGERAEETNGVLKALELQAETVQLPKLYMESGDTTYITGGYGSGDVSTVDGITVVDLSTVYENKNITQGQSVTFRLQYADATVETANPVTSVVLTQRSTTNGVEIASQVVYGSGISVLPDTETSTNTETETDTAPETVTPSGSVTTWNREAEALGAYTPGVQVRHNGKIYLQVADGTLYWDEPTPSSTKWEIIGEDETYIAPAPTAWSREAESAGAYVSGVTVTHNGKTYLQISQDTAWWCEPGSDDSVWEIVE